MSASLFALPTIPNSFSSILNIVAFLVVLSKNMDIDIRMKIINAIKANPGLWDKSCEEYKKIQKRPVLKGNLWIQVAKSLAESGLTVNMDGLKNAWKHMRIQFMNYLDPSQQTRKDLDYELLVHEKLVVLSRTMGIEESNRALITPKKSIDEVIKSDNQEIDVETPVLDEILPPKESVVPGIQKKAFDVTTLLAFQPPVATFSEEKPQKAVLKILRDYPKDSEKNRTSYRSKASPPPIPRHATTISSGAITQKVSNETNIARRFSASPPSIPRHDNPTAAIYQRHSPKTPSRDYTMISKKNNNPGRSMIPPLVPLHATSSTPQVPRHSSSRPESSCLKRKNTTDSSKIPPKKTAPVAILLKNSRPSETRIAISESDLRALKITFSSEDDSKVMRKVEIESQNINNSNDSVAETTPFSQLLNLPIVRDYLNSCISSQYSAPFPPLPNTLSFDYSQYMASMQMMIMGTQYDPVHLTLNPTFGSGTLYDPVATHR